MALFVAMAAETVEDAARRVNAFESEHGGIDNSEVTIDAVEVDDSPNREDITATEYAFEFPESIPAGPTSLVSPTKESRPTSGWCSGSNRPTRCKRPSSSRATPRKRGSSPTSSSRAASPHPAGRRSTRPTSPVSRRSATRRSTSRAATERRAGRRTSDFGPSGHLTWSPSTDTVVGDHAQAGAVGPSQTVPSPFGNRSGPRRVQDPARILVTGRLALVLQLRTLPLNGDQATSLRTTKRMPAAANANP